tara:strand:- start:106 stop:360 length:255 start_codon:yes stop_codon:yes gene_type:complete
MNVDMIINKFDIPYEVREFEKCRFEIMKLPKVIIGEANAGFEDGMIYMFYKYNLFYVSSKPYDSWILGSFYISFKHLGTDQYSI